MRKIVLFITFSLFSMLSFAQERLFSQPFQSGLLMNPALIGTHPDFHTRIGGVYRTQWKVEESPYENYGLYYESKFKQFKYGLIINQNKTGDVGFKRTGVLLSSGLSKKLGRGNNKISFGAQVGFYQMNIDYVKLQFDNQYNPAIGFDGSLGTGEEFEVVNLIQPDINIGLAADFELNTNWRIDGQVGFSVIHINTPGTTFNKELVTLPMNMIFFAKSFIHVSNAWGFEPFFINSIHDFETERKLGLNTGFRLQERSYLKMGFAHNLEGMLTFLTQFDIEKLSLGLSIDANISKANPSFTENNTFELSMIYNIPDKPRSKKTHAKQLLR